MYEIVVIQRPVNADAPIATLIRCHDDDIEFAMEKIAINCEYAHQAGVLLNWTVISHYDRYMK